MVIFLDFCSACVWFSLYLLTFKFAGLFILVWFDVLRLVCCVFWLKFLSLSVRFLLESMVSGVCLFTDFMVWCVFVT